MLEAHSSGGQQSGRAVGRTDHCDALGRCLLTKNFRQVVINDFNVPRVNFARHNACASYGLPVTIITDRGEMPREHSDQPQREYPLMNTEIATLIFAVIMVVGFLVWVCSLQIALGIGRNTAKTDWRMLPEEQPAQANTESGARTVRGTPDRLSAALGRTLVQHHVGTFGSLFEVVERAPNRIVLKKAGPLLCNQPPSMYFSEAEINFESLGNETSRVSYVLGFDRLARRVKIVALAIILGIGLPVLLGVGATIWYFVLPSQNPAVQWQVLQTLQVSHTLWPPYLFLWMYKAGRKHSKTYFSNLLSTLELAE
jgi:hypothetical protein